MGERQSGAPRISVQRPRNLILKVFGAIWGKYLGRPFPTANADPTTLRWAKTRVLKTDTRVSKRAFEKHRRVEMVFQIGPLLSNGRQRVGAF